VLFRTDYTSRVAISTTNSQSLRIQLLMISKIGSKILAALSLQLRRQTDE